MTSLAERLSEWVDGRGLDTLELELARDPWSILEACVERLKGDQSIDSLERTEDLFKRVLGHIMTVSPSGESTRRLALALGDLGLLLKYKSYTIKASSPLGYSIFLQEPGQGFSFQRHIEHKTEVFHILDVTAGGYVFLCEYEDWVRTYEPEAFAAWLEGRPDERYDRHRIWVKPGDVVVINRLGVVHTALGCILEEFATISTDMVDRLHDQNVGKRVPSHFRRAPVQERLMSAPIPSKSALLGVSRGGDVARAPIQPRRIGGAEVRTLAESPVLAQTYRVPSGEATGYQCDAVRATSLFIRRGRGSLAICDEGELQRSTPPTVPLHTGQVVLLPPGVHFAMSSDRSETLCVSEHRLPLETALY